MFGLSILNPIFLAFGVLIALPIFIHLFHRRRFKEIRWAAMDFLLKSQKKSRSMLKLRHLILLLLRCLAIAFIVLAISQPLIKTPTALAGKSTAYAVIVFDNSYSMGEKQGNKLLFDKAKEKASDIIGLLKTGDSVSIITASWKAKATISEPTYQLSAAKKEIEGLKLSSQGTDLGGALQIASALIKKTHEASKEVYIVSDCRASALRAAAPDIKAALLEISGNAAIFLVKAGGEGQANNAVSNVNFSRDMVDTVMPVRITADVTNFSKKDSLDCVADLYINEKLRESKRLVIKAGKTEPAAFYHKFTESGINNGYIEISADPLSADNRVFFSLNVKGAVPVLIVDGKPARKRFDSESGFLSFVFNPYGPEDIGKKNVIYSSVLDLKTVNTDALNKNKVVILSNTSYLPEEVVNPLDSFVRAGGGVLIFSGDLMNPQYMNNRFYKDKSGFLPCILGGRIIPNKEGDTFYIDKINTAHPLMSKFKESELKELRKTRFGSFFELKVDQTDPSVTVLASFNNGMPALVAKKCGKGEAIIISTGADRRWSDLVIKPMFLPLMYEMVYYLSSGTEEKRNLKVGEKLTRTVSFGDVNAIKLYTPDNKQAVCRTSVSAEGRVMEFDATFNPGFYRILSGEKSDYYAVNLDTAVESDTKSAEKELIAKLAPKEKFIVLEDNADTKSLITQGRKGIGIWKELIFLTLLILGLESYLAWKFGKRS